MLEPDNIADLIRRGHDLRVQATKASVVLGGRQSAYATSPHHPQAPHLRSGGGGGASGAPLLPPGLSGLPPPNAANARLAAAVDSYTDAHRSTSSTHHGPSGYPEPPHSHSPQPQRPTPGAQSLPSPPSPPAGGTYASLLKAKRPKQLSPRGINTGTTRAPPHHADPTTTATTTMSAGSDGVIGAGKGVDGRLALSEALAKRLLADERSERLHLERLVLTTVGLRSLEQIATDEAYARQKLLLGLSLAGREATLRAHAQEDIDSAHARGEQLSGVFHRRAAYKELAAKAAAERDGITALREEVRQRKAQRTAALAAAREEWEAEREGLLQDVQAMERTLRETGGSAPSRPSPPPTTRFPAAATTRLGNSNERHSSSPTDNSAVHVPSLGAPVTAVTREEIDDLKRQWADERVQWRIEREAARRAEEARARGSTHESTPVGRVDSSTSQSASATSHHTPSPHTSAHAWHGGGNESATIESAERLVRARQLKTPPQPHGRPQPFADGALGRQQAVHDAHGDRPRQQVNLAPQPAGPSVPPHAGTPTRSGGSSPGSEPSPALPRSPLPLSVQYNIAAILSRTNMALDKASHILDTKRPPAP